ncbi:MAG TPA: SAM-dependent methyltransferase [Gammaproteobacteria bacterium]|nr:SAM-dependent methyltransferase [Gammaproteobacteria bacterium]
MSGAELPVPSGEALQQSAALVEKIRAEIARSGGWLAFARYMELALYAPKLGYYSGGSTKLGAAGDFVTAPELSSALGVALAPTLDGELRALDADTVLELGAGSGALAAQLLDAFAKLGRDVRYLILERSADFRERQQVALRRFAPRVEWLATLPAEPFAGVIVANEVLDALPVVRFAKLGGEARALGVVAAGDGFRWGESRAVPAVAAAVASLERKLGRELRDGHRSELCLALPALLASLGAILTRGSLVFVDYGLVRAEYYHEQRADGTLICHYRHRAHDDPFLYPGLQDITAWVDFSACADGAVAAGLTVAGFTTQGQFLAHALAALPPSLAIDLATPRAQSALKTLLLPGEMGERFKVLLLRNRHEGGPALPGRDFRHRL